MKNIKIVLLLVFVTFALMYVAGNYIFNQPYDPPGRVKDIPLNAIWRGGCDGGNWFELTKAYSNDKFRIKIYDDYNGNLLLDADFVADEKM